MQLNLYSKILLANIFCLASLPKWSSYLHILSCTVLADAATLPQPFFHKIPLKLVCRFEAIGIFHVSCSNKSEFFSLVRNWNLVGVSNLECRFGTVKLSHSAYIMLTLVQTDFISVLFAYRSPTFCRATWGKLLLTSNWLSSWRYFHYACFFFALNFQHNI